jgi:hypothetical protein
MGLREIVRRLIERVIDMLMSRETSLAEFWSSTWLLSWGGWTIVSHLAAHPEDTFAIGTSYRLLSEIAPDWSWGLAAVGLGLAQAGMNLKKWRKGRRNVAFIVACFFAFVGALILVPTPASATPPVWAVAALVQALVYLRLSLPVGRARGSA